MRHVPSQIPTPFLIMDVVLLPRNSSSKLQKEWRDIATQKAKENKEARALCRQRSKKTLADAEPISQAQLPVSDLVGGELTWMNQKLTIVAELGSGTYGKVVKAKTTDNLHVAVKLVRKPSLDELSEFKLLMELSSCPYIVRGLGVASAGGAWSGALVMEVCEGNLWHILREPGNAPRSSHQKLLWSCHIAQAMFALHSYKIIHLDVKINNFLVKEGRALLSDFGLSQVSMDGQAQVVMNKAYAAPYRCPECTSMPSSEAWRGSDVFNI